MRVTAIIAAGGAGRRLGAGVPKQLLDVAGRPMLQRTVEAFTSHAEVADVIVAAPADIAAAPPDWLAGVHVVAGGSRRQDSVANAFAAVREDAEIVLVHDAARPFVSAAVISRAIAGAAEHGAAIVAIPVSDTVKLVDPEGTGAITATLARDRVFLAQTPQAFRRDVLREAVAVGRSGVDATDEASLAERAGHVVRVVAGDPDNVKITTARDLELAQRRLTGAAGESRVGVGYDLHRLVNGRPLVLGGVTIPAELGAQGHSDADVVCHSVTDAILGAARAGDIGQHFPDTDPAWKDASSLHFLREAAALVRRRGWAVENVDVVVLLERPKLAPHRQAVEASLAEALGIDVESVSVKAKTNEGVDGVGRGEAIAAHAVAMLRRQAGR